MSVKEPVYVIQFDFLALYMMYFQSYCANRSTKESQAICNIHVLVVSDMQHSPSARLQISDTIRSVML